MTQHSRMSSPEVVALGDKLVALKQQAEDIANEQADVRAQIARILSDQFGSSAHLSVLELATSSSAYITVSWRQDFDKKKADTLLSEEERRSASEMTLVPAKAKKTLSKARYAECLKPPAMMLTVRK